MSGAPSMPAPATRWRRRVPRWRAWVFRSWGELPFRTRVHPEFIRGRVLARGSTFVVRAAGRVAWCKVGVPRGLDPEQGAASGAAMAAFLVDHILERHSPWLGVVFDIRDGPSVINPLSLSVMENICERAELARRRLAILVGTGATLKDQVTDVARARAPRFATVTDEGPAALDWMTANV